jgi:hypothetical protein
MAREVTVQSKPNPAASLLALALGAAAVGAAAVGALAIGRLAVGRLTIRKARFGAPEVDELTVRKLRVVEHEGRVGNAATGDRPRQPRRQDRDQIIGSGSSAGFASWRALDCRKSSGRLPP